MFTMLISSIFYLTNSQKIAVRQILVSSRSRLDVNRSSKCLFAVDRPIYNISMMIELEFVDNGSSDDTTRPCDLDPGWSSKRLGGTPILRYSPLLRADPRVNTPDSRNVLLKAEDNFSNLPPLRPVVKR